MNKNKNLEKIINELKINVKKDEEIEDKSPILIGLNRIGNTKYMNATLQCLSQTKDLTEYFLKGNLNQV